MKRSILTGTPGCGKTSLLHALEMRGYFVIPEAATDVIAYEQALDVAEPWKDPEFIDKIVSLQRQRQQHASESSAPIQFYDRSPFCTYALAKYLKFVPSKTLMTEIERITENHLYEKKVFFIQNLGFCKPTDARKISYEESLIFEQIHLETYAHFGYDCQMIPSAPLLERMNAILGLILD